MHRSVVFVFALVVACATLLPPEARAEALPPKDDPKAREIMVRVDELSRAQSEGEMQSRKDAQYDAVLTDWIKLIGLKAIKPAVQADGDPRIAGDLRQLFRAEGDMGHAKKEYGKFFKNFYVL